jgi:hypothetical protein
MRKATFARIGSMNHKAWRVASVGFGAPLRRAIATMQMVAIGMDFNAYLKMAESLGYSCTAAAELAPACEAGVTAALNERIRS